MEIAVIEILKQFPVELLSQISNLLKDDEKYNELEQALEKSGLTFESKTYNRQFAIKSKDELKAVKDFLKGFLIPA